MRDLDALTSSTLKHLREHWWDDAFTAFLAETLQPRPGKSILDVGCGSGTAELGLARLRVSQLTLVGVDLVFDRVRKRAHRPLLRNGDPKEVLARLMTQRYPIYAEADVVVDSTAQPADRTTEQVIEALRAHLQTEKTPA